MVRHGFITGPARCAHRLGGSADTTSFEGISAMSYPNYQSPPGPQRHVQVTKRGANHGLHVFLSIITCGLWAITGWPIAAAMGLKTKTIVTTPPQGPYAAQQPHPGHPPQDGYYGPSQAGSWPAQGQYPPEGQPPTTSWGRPPQQ
jgi:hypothetical protein